MTDLDSALHNLQQQAATLAEITSDLRCALRRAASAELVSETLNAVEQLESLHTTLLSTVARLSACIRDPRGVG